MKSIIILLTRGGGREGEWSDGLLRKFEKSTPSKNLTEKIICDIGSSGIDLLKYIM
jgi:hypothetical protein